MAAALGLAAEIGELRTFLADLGRFRPRLAAAATSAMRNVTNATVGALRAELEAAGIKRGDRAARRFGQSLPNSWRGRTYPDRAGAAALDPAGQITTLAPKIIAWLAEGPTVAAASGRYLAVPLKDAVRLGLDRVLLDRGRGARLTKLSDLTGLGRLFGGKTHLIPLKGRAGDFLLAIDTAVYAAQGFKARAARRAERTGIVPLFLFLHQVQGKKRINPAATVDRSAGALIAELDGAFSRVDL